MSKDNLPEWQCHKRVNADEIIRISSINQNNYTATLHLKESGPIIVSAEYMEKHEPQVGGFYVLYADGYESFSPAAPFLNGYSRVE